MKTMVKTIASLNEELAKVRDENSESTSIDLNLNVLLMHLCCCHTAELLLKLIGTE